MDPSTTLQNDRDAKGSRSSSWTVRLLISLISSLPRFATEPVAWLLAWLYRLVAPRKLRRARANLQLALGHDLDSARRDRLARASLVHQAVSLIETVRAVQRAGSVEIEGSDEFARQIRDVEQSGRGQILVTAHLGSWELLNRAATELAAQGFFALAKEPGMAAANSLLDHVRRGAGTEVLPSGAKSSLKRMVAVLKARGWIGLAMDQRPEGPGIPVSFFGRRTEFVPGPSRLIESLDCGVLAAFCVRIGRARYRLIARPVTFEPGASRQAITQRLAEELEAAIRDCPEQWLWTYKRWPEPPRPRAG